MDKPAESLMRASLHDLANSLSGIRGILDLSDPRAPLTTRDRDRLESVILEGLLTLERARHLCLGTLPDASLEQGDGWRAALREQLRPLEQLFRTSILLQADVQPAYDRWPGDLMRGWVQAVTRQVLAYAQGPQLTVALGASEFAWSVRWFPLSSVPEALTHPQEDRPRDIASRWVDQAGRNLGVQWTVEGHGLLATVPRL